MSKGLLGLSIFYSQPRPITSGRRAWMLIYPKNCQIYNSGLYLFLMSVC